MTKALRDFGKRLAQREGLVPLQPGQMRPDGYYMVNHASGESRVPRGAVIVIGAPKAATEDAEEQPAGTTAESS